MTTNDHIVPQAYLRRFAEQRRTGGYFIQATALADPIRTFTTNVRNIAPENGFYWGTNPDGTPEHEMEDSLQRIESGAA